MKSQQGLWTQAQGWRWGDAPLSAAKLVLCFGAPQALEQSEAPRHMKLRYPEAVIASCSTGGEIFGADVFDDSVSALALSFEHTSVSAVSVRLEQAGGETAAGQQLARTLFRRDLAAILIFSDGTQVNGSALIRAVRDVTGPGVVVTGGLAGDGPHFVRTLTGLDGDVTPGQICAIGLYGARIRIGHGSAGGWDVFGPVRTVTKADGTRLYELDGRPALDLYKAYLGEEALRLPGSALLFPLQIFAPGDGSGAIVRTVVGVDEYAKAMVFAGDIPQGWSARLMKCNFDRLVHGAADAAQQAHSAGAIGVAAILVSCIGRKLLMGQRIGDEVEAVQRVLGADAAISGFYSYGEISPHAKSGVCELHNQTMTITTLWEV
jgi:hypothetical protein